MKKYFSPIAEKIFASCADIITMSPFDTDGDAMTVDFSDFFE